MRYRIYGIDLESDVALPGLIEAHSSKTDASHLTLGTTLPEVTGELLFKSAGTDDAVEVWRPNPNALHLRFCDGTAALIARDSIKLSWPDSLTFDDAITYLVGPVLGAVIRLEGRQVLHASAVEVDGGAVAVFGPAGAGKSTTTAALVERGFPLVTEDVAALHERSLFRGGARVKLWEDSVAALKGSPDALPRIVPSNPDWPKRFLEAKQVTSDQVPLRIMFALERRDVSAPFVEEMSGSARVLALLANVYAGGLLDAAGRARQLEALTELAKGVPVKRLVYPNTLSSLAKTVDVLLSHL